MLLTSPWVVHFNFEQSFQKPPLQYWLTVLTLCRLENHTLLAVRMWSAIYGVLTLIVAVWLAFLIDPTRPWLMPLTAAILVSSPLFSSEAGRGLLDIGLAFYTTIALVFAQPARKHPGWWLGVAVACWLGSPAKNSADLSDLAADRDHSIKLAFQSLRELGSNWLAGCQFSPGNRRDGYLAARPDDQISHARKERIS